MKKYGILLLLTFLQISLLKAQVVKSKIVQILEESKKAQNIQLTSNSNYKIDSLHDADCATGEIDAIRHKGGLWLMVNGTSKVYKVKQDGLVTRLDNTCYQGFNFGATNISYQDTLYSIGGYGFWQTTGSVRYFNETTGEWDIVRGIKDVPFAGGINAFSFFDKQNGKLFILYTPVKPEYVKQEENKIEQVVIQCFDFKSKQWWEEGKKINPKIAKKFSDLIFIQKLETSVLFNSRINGKTLLMKLNENKIEEIDERYNTELVQLKNSKNNYITYTIGDTVKIFDLDKNAAITSYIKPNQLKPYNEPLYVSKNTIEAIIKMPWLRISIIINGLLILVTLFLLIQRSRTKKIITAVSETIVGDGPEKEGRKIKDYINNLTIIEKEIIELIVKNSLEGHNTTVTQLNKILGTEKKSFKIQNNIRGEILTLVNQKFMAFASVNNNLIERQRSEFDKRHVEYFINDKYLKKFTLKLFEKL